MYSDVDAEVSIVQQCSGDPRSGVLHVLGGWTVVHAADGFSCQTTHAQSHYAAGLHAADVFGRSTGGSQTAARHIKQRCSVGAVVVL